MAVTRIVGARPALDSGHVAIVVGPPNSLLVPGTPEALSIEGLHAQPFTKPCAIRLSAVATIASSLE